ncbi:MAG: tRNA (guanosine(37)-N1)-methyltransferase TrmD [Brevinema sp.]
MSFSKIAVLSVFPDMVSHALSFGVLKRAHVECLDLRKYAPQGRVDAPVFGPGSGMLFRADILAKAVDDYKKQVPDVWVVHLSPRGNELNAEKVKELARKHHVLLIASRYEGVDQRFIDHYVDEEISIGSYVLTGGELAAAVVADSVLRQHEEVLKSEATQEESFENNLLEYPHYCAPQCFMGEDVPSILKSGDHAKIAQWRFKQSIKQTWLVRPDLLRDIPLYEEMNHPNKLTKIKKQNILLRKRVEALEEIVQEIKDARKRKGSLGNGSV